MAIIEDYCELCGSSEVESVKVVTQSGIIWKSIGIKCGHETVICVQLENTKK